ncbi:MAG: hypothetical protein K2Q97_10040, partial [Burkholderiaceae bacterium]|nr:hypothetical protein [Burkholderiaceae bacterium]
MRSSQSVSCRGGANGLGAEGVRGSVMWEISVAVAVAVAVAVQAIEAADRLTAAGFCQAPSCLLDNARVLQAT